MHPSSRDAGYRRRRVAGAALSVVVLATLSGCPAVGQPAPDVRAGPSAAGTGRPYPGPPADAPPSAGPLRTVEGAVDLSAASPPDYSHVQFAVAAPDGTAYATLAPFGSSHPPRLATVRPTGNGFALTGSVEMTGVDDIWGLHLSANGAVVATGSLRTPDRRRAGYGVAVVDPDSGRVRTTVVEPYAGKTEYAFGRSALAPDGRTLYLFLSTLTRAGARERLVVVDAVSGAVTTVRDLVPDVAAVSERPAGHELAGMVPLPGGGVTLVVDAAPDRGKSDRIPTLLSYDAALEPVGGPVRATAASERAQTHAVSAGADGTTFLVDEVADGGGWVMAIPPGGGPGPVLAQLGDSYDYALLVEPAQVWGLLPAPGGVRPVDLTNGDLLQPVDLHCPHGEVRMIVPGANGRGALVTGECNSPRTRAQMLWILGP